jgi:hypothetical protein
MICQQIQNSVKRSWDKSQLTGFARIGQQTIMIGFESRQMDSGCERTIGIIERE